MEYSQIVENHQTQFWGWAQWKTSNLRGRARTEVELEIVRVIAEVLEEYLDQEPLWWTCLLARRLPSHLFCPFLNLQAALMMPVLLQLSPRSVHVLDPVDNHKCPWKSRMLLYSGC